MKKSPTSIDLSSNHVGEEASSEIHKEDFYSGKISWFEFSGSENSPRQDSLISEADDEELTYTGPELNLRDAVFKRYNRRIATLVKQGVSWQEADEDKMTVFHHLALEDIHAHSTWSALFLTPRKNLYDFVMQMSLEVDHAYATMAKWHIIGLKRVLCRQDKWNRMACSYASQPFQSKQWGPLFSPSIKHLNKLFDDILKNYRTEFPPQSV